MRKIQVLAVSLTLLLAVPLTALGIAQAAYLTDRFGEFILSVVTPGKAISLDELGWLAEFASRWPEVAGMGVGMVVILLILIVARLDKLDEGKIT